MQHFVYLAIFPRYILASYKTKFWPEFMKYCIWKSGSSM